MSDTPKRRAAGRLAITPSLAPRDLDRPRSPAMAWQARLITLFPEAFPGILGLSLTGRALKDGALGAGDDRPAPFLALANTEMSMTHRQAAGRAWCCGPMCWTARLTRRNAAFQRIAPLWPLVYLSPRGRPFTQSMARDWSCAKGVTLPLWPF